MGNDLTATLLVAAIQLQRSAIKAAVEQSPELGIDLIADYFNEAGVDDAETRALLDRWWEQRKAQNERDAAFQQWCSMTDAEREAAINRVVRLSTPS